MPVLFSLLTADDKSGKFLPTEWNEFNEKKRRAPHCGILRIVSAPRFGEATHAHKGVGFV